MPLEDKLKLLIPELEKSKKELKALLIENKDIDHSDFMKVLNISYEHITESIVSIEGALGILERKKF